jgi:hypothetical protein
MGICALFVILALWELKNTLNFRALFKDLTVDYVDLIQWPAMAVTVTAAWFVASKSESRRGIGFWCFLGSNLLWIIWGWHTDAYALMVLQVCLALMNIRGAKENEAA